jgi:hypothetical protein
MNLSCLVEPLRLPVPCGDGPHAAGVVPEVSIRLPDFKDFSRFRHLLSPSIPVHALSNSPNLCCTFNSEGALLHWHLRAGPGGQVQQLAAWGGAASRGSHGGITCVNPSPVTVQRICDRLAAQGTHHKFQLVFKFAQHVIPW